MKVKQFIKVFNSDTKIIFFDNYGGTAGLYQPNNVPNIPKDYLEMKVERAWVDSTLNIRVDGVIF